MDKGSMNELSVLCGYEYHKTEQARHALEEFSRKFLLPFVDNASVEYLQTPGALGIEYSDIELLEVLHQSKHEVEHLAHMYFVESPVIKYGRDNIPEEMLREYDEVIPDNAQPYGLIGNAFTANAPKQAACFVYWIVKLRPITNVFFNDVEDKNYTDDDTDLLSKNINELFALYITFGMLRSEMSEEEKKKLQPADKDQLEDFLHLLRYKKASHEAIANILKLLGNNLLI